MSDLNKNNDLISEVKFLIEQSRQQVAATVNSAITLLYWQIGKRINEEILRNTRADYGKQIVHTLSAQLVLEYGKGWGEKHLRHCLRIAETFQDKEIIYTLCRQLSWSHIRLVIYMEDNIKRDFYIEMCKLENSNIKVAEYLTVLPDLKIIEQKLHRAIEIARNKTGANE